MLITSRDALLLCTAIIFMTVSCLCILCPLLHCIALCDKPVSALQINWTWLDLANCFIGYMLICHLHQDWGNPGRLVCWLDHVFPNQLSSVQTDSAQRPIITPPVSLHGNRPPLSQPTHFPQCHGLIHVKVGLSFPDGTQLKSPRRESTVRSLEITQIHLDSNVCM